jgi:prepilin-type N-terminal cleavage/methylation domain-containing protein
MRRAFSLIELMISITILALMMIFLYQSYASLNHSNSFYKKEVSSIKSEEILKKVIFLDFSLAMNSSVQVLDQDVKEDIVFMQSANSLHDRFHPYIAYIIKNFKLYRLESLKAFTEYPLPAESEFSADYLGEVNSFRVYPSDSKKSSILLVHVDFKEKEDILLKIKVMNEK